MTRRIEGFEFLVDGTWIQCWGRGGPLGAGSVHAVNAGLLRVEDVCDQLRMRAVSLGFAATQCRPVGGGALHASQHGHDTTARNPAALDECGATDSGHGPTRSDG